MDLIQRAAARIRAREANAAEREPWYGDGIAADPTGRDPADLMPGAAPDPAASPPRHSRRIALDYGRLAAAGIITRGARQTALVEEFRVIKRRLLELAFQPRTADHPNTHMIMVTSAGPGEGKTFTSLNLAMSLTLERDLNVLLIDSDVHRQTLADLLGIRDEKGLLDLLRDPSLEPADVLLRTDIPNFTVMAAGTRDSVSPELMSSTRMENLIADMARRYEDRVIVFDAPPCLASIEPGVLAMHVGQVLFVVEAERTRRSMVEGSLSLIRACPNIALVLNKCRIREPQQFGAYSYYTQP